ncbi:hypothetical protein [Planomicrobium sp. CPCC 101079]|nr:hypothetical protein [Planomicrobium sp. CPCC 101079]
MIIEPGEFLHNYISISMIVLISFALGSQWGSLKNGSKKAD